MAGFFQERVEALLQASMTAPTFRTWMDCAGLYAGFLLTVFLFRWRTRFPNFKFPLETPRNPFWLALGLFFHPSLTEEALFRVLLLPRPGAGTLRWKDAILAAMSLSVFVLWHPLNGVLFRKSARRLFKSAGFLLPAASLGLVCTLAYWISRSLWPPVAMHWLTVTGWFLFFGARRDLAGEPAG